MTMSIECLSIECWRKWNTISNLEQSVCLQYENKELGKKEIMYKENILSKMNFLRYRLANYHWHF